MCLSTRWQAQNIHSSTSVKSMVSSLLVEKNKMTLEGDSGQEGSEGGCWWNKVLKRWGGAIC